MAGFFEDLRFAARLLIKSPAFTTVAVLTLALGIGATTAIFSIVNTSLLRPLPYDEPRELLFFLETSPTFGEMSIAYPNYLDWRAQARAVEELSVYRRERINLTGAGDPEQVRATMVSDNLFRALGVAPLLGRGFTAAEDRPGGEAVVVLEHGYWQRRFGGDPDIIGTTLILNGDPYQVVGVMPPELRHPTMSDLFVPIGRYSDNPSWQERGNHQGIYGLARMAPGVTVEEAQAEIDAIALAITEQYPEIKGNGVEYRVLEDFTVRNIRPAMYLLSGAVALVLLIACVNIANLMLARTVTREREFAVRTAVGASRARVVRQVLTESLLLALLGGALGVLVAQLGIDLIRALFSNQLPRVDEIAIDGGMLAFTAGLALTTGIAFGLLPAFQGAHTPLAGRLHAGARGGEGRDKRRTQNGLVVAEIALALMLLVGAGLLLRSFAGVLEVDPGFEPDGVHVAQIRLPSERYTEDQAVLQFWETLLPEIQALPGVEDAGLTLNLPFVGGYQTSFTVAGQPEPPANQRPFAEYSRVTPSYFSTMGMRLKGGRLLDARDHAEAPSVMVIDQAFAAAHWPGEDPIGMLIRRGSHDDAESGEPVTVVGVVETVRHNGLDVEPPRPQMYFPLAQGPARFMTLVVKSHLPASVIEDPIRRAVLAVSPEQPVRSVTAFGEIIDDSLAQRRLGMTLLGLFAGVAVLLALIGIYGVVSYGVTRRTQEFGVRMAMGARGSNILALVLRQVAVISLIGIAIGAAGALALGGYLESQLFGISARDPLTFTLIPVLLIAFALAACLLPARRAARTDPMEVLRNE